MSTLVIDDLHATVAGFEILRGVSLEAASGEVHAVMGPNGCGKSTLAHTLMGRSDYTVTAGRVTLDGSCVCIGPCFPGVDAGAGLLLAGFSRLLALPLAASAAAWAARIAASASFSSVISREMPNVPTI